MAEAHGTFLIPLHCHERLAGETLPLDGGAQPFLAAVNRHVQAASTSQKDGWRQAMMISEFRRPVSEGRRPLDGHRRAQPRRRVPGRIGGSWLPLCGSWGRGTVRPPRSYKKYRGACLGMFQNVGAHEGNL